jgi:hypothetical protein
MTGTQVPLEDLVDDDAVLPPAPVGLGDKFRHLLASDQSAPLYPRLLRLQHVQPKAWQRALLVEGMAVAGGLVALADKATSWAPVILPVAAAAVVKFHDVLAGVLPPRPVRRDDPA